MAETTNPVRIEEFRAGVSGSGRLTGLRHRREGDDGEDVRLTVDTAKRRRCALQVSITYSAAVSGTTSTIFIRTPGIGAAWDVLLRSVLFTNRQYFFEQFEGSDPVLLAPPSNVNPKQAEQTPNPELSDTIEVFAPGDAGKTVAIAIHLEER